MLAIPYYNRLRVILEVKSLAYISFNKIKTSSYTCGLSSAYFEAVFCTLVWLLVLGKPEM